MVEEEGYTLKTFPMEYSDARKGEDGIGPATIGGFTAELSDRTLARIGNAWYAADSSDDIPLAEEIEPQRSTQRALRRTFQSTPSNEARRRGIPAYSITDSIVQPAASISRRSTALSVNGSFMSTTLFPSGQSATNMKWTLSRT
jgi:hypothetical protein